MEKDMAIKTYLQAINDAMRQEMERDEMCSSSVKMWASSAVVSA